MTNEQIESDYRLQELLTALNEGLIAEEVVREELNKFAGDHVDLIRYSSGEYDILIS